MAVINPRRILGIAAAMLLLTAAGTVKDLSTLQTGVSYARANLEKAKTAYQTDIREVQRQQQIIAEQKKELEERTRQLEETRKSADQAWQQYLQAKEKYDKAQSALDAAINRK